MLLYYFLFISKGSISVAEGMPSEGNVLLDVPLQSPCSILAIHCQLEVACIQLIVRVQSWPKVLRTTQIYIFTNSAASVCMMAIYILQNVMESDQMNCN